MDTRKDFTIVYEAAEALDEAQLQAFIKADGCIDVCEGLFTPAAKLIINGKLKAAELLMNLGANKHEMAKGAAFIGNITYAEMLRNIYGVNPSFIALGAAAGGHKHYAEWLKVRHGVSQEYLLWGAAYLGNEAYIKQLSTVTSGPINYGPLSFHAALSKQYELIRKWCVDYPRLKSEIVLQGIRGAACVGDKQFVEELFGMMDKKALEAEAGRLIVCIFAGKHQHIDLALKLVPDKKPFFMLAVTHGLMIGGYINSAKEFIEKYKLIWDVKIHFDFCNMVLPEIRNERHFFAWIRFNAHKQQIKKVKERRLVQGITYLKICIESGYLNLAIQYCQIFFKKYPIFENALMKWVSNHRLFAHPNLALHQFSFIKDDISLQHLAENNENLSLRFKKMKLKAMYEFTNECVLLNVLGIPLALNSHIPTLVPQAKKINQLRSNYHFDFDQANVFISNKALRVLLIMLPLSQKEWPLSLDVLSIVIPYFGLELNQIKSASLIKQFHCIKHSQALKGDIERYLKSTGIDHKQRAKSFLAASTEKRDEASLKGFIGNQFAFFSENLGDKHSGLKHEQPLSHKNKEEGFYALLERGVKRFG